MKKISVKLNLLLFSLRKKAEKLEEMKALTFAQADHKERSAEAWTAILAEKQKLIEEIEKLDHAFAGISAEIMPSLKADPQSYAETVREMKAEIRRIAELTGQIEAAERKNYTEKILRSTPETAEQERERIPRQKALGKYQKMKK